MSELKPTILIVDDQLDNVRMLSAMLTQHGYRVRQAINGQIAVETVQAEPPDLVLLDICMTPIDGYEVCALLKTHFATKDIPIIFLSALNDCNDKVRAFQVGGADYVTKPFQMDEVLARIHHQLTIRKQQQQLVSQNQQLQQEIVERQKAEETIRQQAQRDHLLSLVMTRLRQSLQLNDVLTVAVTELQRLLQVDRALIYQFGSAISLAQGESLGSSISTPNAAKISRPGKIVVEAVRSPHLSIINQPEFQSCFQHNCPLACEQERIHIVEDCQVQMTKPGCRPEFLKRYQIFANVEVPIFQRDQLWGLLILHQCMMPRHWQAWEVSVLQQLADQLALAIQQSELYRELQQANQQLKRLATIDELTQVANRRSFDAYLDKEWRRLRRDQGSLALLFCDVDYFKYYNDTYGHQAGDRCLQKVANALKQSVKRPADIVARYGGEEFAVILPNTTIEGAIHLTIQIQQAIANLQVPHKQSTVSDSVTLSIGIACIIPDLTNSIDTLLSIADHALYAAKTQGRNTYRVCTELPKHHPAHDMTDTSITMSSGSMYQRQDNGKS